MAKNVDVVIRSPFSGTLILSPSVRSEGAFVSAGERIGSVLDTSCWQVLANIPGERLGSIRTGDSVGVRILAHPDSTPISGVVADIRLREIQDNNGVRLIFRATVQLTCAAASQPHIGPGLPIELRLLNPPRERLRMFP